MPFVPGWMFGICRSRNSRYTGISRFDGMRISNDSGPACPAGISRTKVPSSTFVRTWARNPPVASRCFVHFLSRR